jgi:rare lipoprotein A
VTGSLSPGGQETEDEYSENETGRISQDIGDVAVPKRDEELMKLIEDGQDQAAAEGQGEFGRRRHGERIKKPDRQEKPHQAELEEMSDLVQMADIKININIHGREQENEKIKREGRQEVGPFFHGKSGSKLVFYRMVLSNSRAQGKIFFLMLGLGFFFLSGCRPKVDYFPGGGVQTGVASWYGEEFHGRRTSNREVYDMNDLTAAHNTLPFGSMVMVTNLDNGKSVVVRINDRGPFVKNRVIDLSYAAARAIDMIGTGTAPVRIEVMSDVSPPMATLRFYVQLGSFIQLQNAEALRLELSREFSSVTVSSFRTSHQVYYRVRIRTDSREAAEAMARRLSDLGYTAIIFEEQ